jgi:hypothetical protein
VCTCVLQNKRYALLGAFAFAQGATIGPLVELALAISPALLITATLSTAAIFTCFTLSALFTKRRSVAQLVSWQQRAYAQGSRAAANLRARKLQQQPSEAMSSCLSYLLFRPDVCMS